MLHKELDSVRSKIASANEQLRKEMEARLESAGLETRKMFEQIMLKLEAHRDVGFEGSGSTGSLDMKQKGIMGVMPENRASTTSTTEVIDLTSVSKPFTKYSKLQSSV